MASNILNGWSDKTLEELMVDRRKGIKRGPFGGVLKKEIFVADGYQVYEQQNVIYNDLKRGRYYINETKFQEMHDFAVQPGDILISCSGTVGKAAIVPDGIKPGVINQALLRLRPAKDKVDTTFFWYLLSSDFVQAQLLGMTHGSALKNIVEMAQLRKVAFSIPPLAEQRRIAEILSTWDRAIDLTAQLIAAKQQRKRGLMQALLTGTRRFAEFEGEEWKYATIVECADILDNRRVPLNEKQRSSMRGDIPYWGANSIVGYIDDYIFDETIVLLAEDGGYFEDYETRPIANISYGKAWVNNHAHVLRANKQTINEWLYYSLVHKNILPYINSGTLSKLNQADMVRIIIPVPSVDEQRRIATVLAACDREIALIQHKRDLLRQQKQGLMQQLLTGQRRV